MEIVSPNCEGHGGRHVRMARPILDWAAESLHAASSAYHLAPGARGRLTTPTRSFAHLGG